jgi:anti-anti-sigma factor
MLKIDEGTALPLADNLKVTLERIADVDDCLMVHLDGFVDTLNTASLEQRVAVLIGKGYKNLIFNCAALSSVSSAGLGSFAAFLHLSKSAGGDIVLLRVQPLVEQVFDLLGFTAFLNIRGSAEDAIAFFLSHRNRGQGGGLFPRDCVCPQCGCALVVDAPGRYRCIQCKTVLTVNGGAAVSLG